MSVSWLEWIADPKRRALTKNTKVLGALYWLEVADHQLQENPEAPDWLEGLAECCLSLSLAFEDSERLNGIEVSIALAYKAQRTCDENFLIAGLIHFPSLCLRIFSKRFMPRRFIGSYNQNIIAGLA